MSSAQKSKNKIAVGQAGGPTPVINAALVGFVRAALEAFEHVVGLEHGLEGALKESFVDFTQSDDNLLDLLLHTSAAALGSSRYKLSDHDCEKIIRVFQQHDIHHLALIGGNGSMWMAHHLSEAAVKSGFELNIVGIPKTIDNDLPCTDHTPGYGSAARFLALAVRDAGLDLEAMKTFDDVIILEAMGRDSGWLAASSALAKESADNAPHLIYIPEISFDETQFLADVRQIHARLGYVFVVVGEGIRNVNGLPVGGTNLADSLGRTLYSLTDGPALHLTRLTREKLGLQTRFLRPNTIGRSLSTCVSETDRAEAAAAGDAAARLLAQGKNGLMVTLERSSDTPYTCKTGTVSLSEAANSPAHLLPRSFMDTTGTMINDAFRDYALPLIGDIPSIARLPKSGAKS